MWKSYSNLDTFSTNNNIINVCNPHFSHSVLIYRWSEIICNRINGKQCVTLVYDNVTTVPIEMWNWNSEFLKDQQGFSNSVSYF